MASFKYNDYQNSFKNDQTQNQSNNKNRVYYFDLKNDGEEAIVKFMYDSVEEFNIFSVHTLQIDGKWRKINCLNEQYETDKCPLCSAGNKAQNKFFIKLIEYVKNEDGTVSAYPRIWERSTAYLGTLRSLMEEYGPLSDNTFKVKRNGAKGSKETKYDILYANPTIYKPEIYVKDASLFENFDFFKGFILNKTADEMVSILDPQSAPAPTQQNQQYQKPVQPIQQPVRQQPQYQQPQQPRNQFNSTNPPQQSTSFQNQTQAPRRTYNF